jgi:hypothetical protein
MPLEVGPWRHDGDTPVKVTPSGVPLESQLERMVEANPTILGTPLPLALQDPIDPKMPPVHRRSELRHRQRGLDSPALDPVSVFHARSRLREM